MRSSEVFVLCSGDVLNAADIRLDATRTKPAGTCDRISFPKG